MDQFLSDLHKASPLASGRQPVVAELGYCSNIYKVHLRSSVRHYTTAQSSLVCGSYHPQAEYFCRASISLSRVWL